MSDSDGSSFPEGCSYIIKLWPVGLVLAVVLLVVLIGQSIGNVVEVAPQPTDDASADDTGADGIGNAVDEFSQVDWPGVCASAYVLPVVALAIFVLRDR